MIAVSLLVAMIRYDILIFFWLDQSRDRVGQPHMIGMHVSSVTGDFTMHWLVGILGNPSPVGRSIPESRYMIQIYHRSRTSKGHFATGPETLYHRLV